MTPPQMLEREPTRTWSGVVRARIASGVPSSQSQPPPENGCISAPPTPRREVRGSPLSVNHKIPASKKRSSDALTSQVCASRPPAARDHREVRCVVTSHYRPLHGLSPPIVLIRRAWPVLGAPVRARKLEPDCSGWPAVKYWHHPRLH